MDTGVFGILFGYMLYPIISSVILSVSIKRTVHGQPSSESKTIALFLYIKEISIASISFWIPNVINIIGAQLGTIIVYISVGADYAAVYFISFSIVAGISLILSVLSTIAYPTISSMQDGRKTATWRLIKISLIITLPLSVFSIFYSEDLLGLFGSVYTSGTSSLQVMLLSILPTSIIYGIGVLVYAYGNNSKVLTIGLFTGIPRTFFYFIFVPIFGINGAALTYLVGTISGCVFSLIIANKLGMKILWKQIFLILIIPALLTFFWKFIDIHFIISLVGTLAISYILFLVLRLINKEDVRDILKVLPEVVSEPLNTFIIKLCNKLSRS
jgi:O-antigen/teichoic acid export membrane protein